jgi:Rrf2 family protein
MLVTRETDYAVRCVLYLARDENQVTSVDEVARRMRIPRSFLAKIIQRLVRVGVVESIRGRNGGFKIAKKPSDISLLDITEAIQGPAYINFCAVNSRKCRICSTCLVHPIWIELQKALDGTLRAQTIDRLAGRN